MVYMTGLLVTWIERLAFLAVAVSGFLVLGEVFTSLARTSRIRLTEEARGALACFAAANLFWIGTILWLILREP